MIEVLDLTTRPISRCFKIYREVRTTAGIARRDVPCLDGADGLSIYAPSAEVALERARLLVRDTRGLVAVAVES